jgi:xylulokinase
MLCLGIDSGTTSTRTLVLDVESGKIIAFAQKTYKTIADLPQGHAEQAPQTWIEAVEATIRKCLAKINHRQREVVAIGVGAQQHGPSRTMRKISRSVRPNFGATHPRRPNLKD